MQARDWAIKRIDTMDCDDSIEQVHDRLAMMDEWYEWFDPKEDLEVVSLDEITEKQYDDFVENNDGVERG